MTFLVSFQWWRDVIYEGLYEGSHTYIIMSGLSMGTVGFIVSEVCFFFSFFWVFFYLSLGPDIVLGLSWPPVGLLSVSFLGLPFLNTMILLCSGFFITLCHINMAFSFYSFFYSYFVGLVLGVYFVLIQFYEYFNLGYDLSDSSYGSTFYILTGFHGLHVILGLFFLLVNFFRFYFNHFGLVVLMGFNYSVWYWHFVDVVWLFLYLFIYWWGSNC